MSEQHDAHVREWRMAVGQTWLVSQLWWQLRRMMDVPVA